MRKTLGVFEVFLGVLAKTKDKKDRVVTESGVDLRPFCMFQR